jgi:uncharacterized damage-inducible protein DinB
MQALPATYSVPFANSGGLHLNRPLAELFRYNKWATHTLLDACRGLTPDQLEASAASGPVREVLTHLVGSQQTFVLRTRGRQHEGELSRQSPWPGSESLIEIALNTSDELIEIAEALDEEVEVDLPFMGQVYRFPRSFFLVHALEHGRQRLGSGRKYRHSTNFLSSESTPLNYASSSESRYVCPSSESS